jgi:hypothetical protein
MRRILASLAVLVQTSTVLAAEPTSATAVRGGIRAQTAAVEADHAPEPRDEDDGGWLEHSGWYVAPTAGVTTVNGEGTAEFGFRGAWLINRRFGIGLAGIGWANGPEMNGRNMDGGYGGVLLQYVYASESFVHATTQTILGGGAYCGSGDGETGNCKESHGFFTSDSTLNLEMNINENMRVTLGGGYRFVIAGDSSPISSTDLRGFVARTSIEVGQF